MSMFDFDGMDAKAALSGSAQVKARFGYISKMTFGKKEIPAADGMKIHPLNEPTKDLPVLATLESFTWSGAQDGPIMFYGICCDAAHTQMQNLLQTASTTNIDLTFECYEYHQQQDFFVARKAELKSVVTIDASSHGPSIGLSERPVDAANGYYIFSMQLAPQPQHKNEIHLSLKQGHTGVKPWGHDKG